MKPLATLALTSLVLVLLFIGTGWAQRGGQATADRPGRSTASGSPSDVPAGRAETKATTTAKHEPPAVDYWSMLFVFVLASFIGLGVIGRVSRLLHTPLMSLTNAISAIAVVGSIMVTGTEGYPLPIRIMGAVALFASMTNIVSGFLITDRMLRMFKQTRQPV
jgi:NAD(P) transhydrogenase subunit alpha